MARHIEIVVNPASGSHLGAALAEHHVKPLLASALGLSDPNEIRVRQTEREGDGRRIGNDIVRDFMAPASTSSVEREVDIVVIGGDGTTHELLNGLFLRHDEHGTTITEEGNEPVLNFRLAIVPGGTANALYSAMYPDEWTQEVQHKVASAGSIDEFDADMLRRMLKGAHKLASSLSSKASEAREQLVPLPMMINVFSETKTTIISHLVTSHALHAAILHDADTTEMRAKHKGIERFKAAAQMNATRWTHGTVVLYPGSPAAGGGCVEQYSPQTRAFERVPDSERALTLRGPFLYLNVMLTDRLESSFIPAPLSSAFSRLGSTSPKSIDVVAIRPLRDPTISQQASDEGEAGVKFATTRLGEITAGMYNGGKHIDLVYSEAGGEAMVEYFRCQEFSFMPETEESIAQDTEKSRLVCTDGFISSGGHTRVSRWKEGTELPALKRGLKTPLVWH